MDYLVLNIWKNQKYRNNSFWCFWCV